MFVLTLDIYIRSLLYPHDILFLFAANGMAVNVIMLALAGLAVVISFGERFKSWWIYAGCAMLAVVLSILGLLSVFPVSFSYRLSGILMPLNGLMVLEAAVILGICVLSYRHAPCPDYVRWPAVNRHSALKKLAGLAPAFPRWTRLPAGLERLVSLNK